MTDSNRKALVTGITGQDGSYLAELLLEKGYEVHGIVRRSSSFNTDRIDHLYRDPHEQGVRLFTHYGDLTDPVALTKLLYELQPDEIYNLGAQSHVRVSFDIPEYTFDVTGGRHAAPARGDPRVGRAARASTRRPRRRCSARPRRRSPRHTPFHPRSPYAVAKVAAYWAAVNYREAYGMFASNGILFNHESERRGETFVTRKITRAVARIKHGLQDKLYLGNLDAKRDWGYAPDYVEAMWLMLQADEPDDYVIATGETHSVREFLELAFAHAGPRLGGARRDRPALLPPGRGRRAARRREQGAREARLGAQGRLRGAGRADGRRRRRARSRTSSRARSPATATRASASPSAAGRTARASLRCAAAPPA